jgi:hypothetical protein
MKSKTKKRHTFFEDDYNKIMKDFHHPDIPSFQTPPIWINQYEFISKFSLYQESPYSITSTNTSINI